MERTEEASYISSGEDCRPSYHLPRSGVLERLMAFYYSKGRYYVQMCCLIDQQKRIVEAESTDLVHWTERVMDASPDDITGAESVPYMSVVDDEGRRILIGQLKNAGYLTLPYVAGEGAAVHPLPALQAIRGQEETAEGYAMKHLIKLHPYAGECYELIVDVLDNESTAFFIELRASKKEATRVIYDSRARRVTLDCQESSTRQQSERAHQSVHLANDLKQLHIFVDSSSIELFINKGEAALSAAIFPDVQSTAIRTATESGQVYFKLTKYDLKHSDIKS